MKQPFWNNKPIRPTLPRLTLVAPGGLESSYFGTQNGLELTDDGRYLQVFFIRAYGQTTNYIYVYDTLNGSLLRTITSTGGTIATTFLCTSMSKNTNTYIAAANLGTSSNYGSQSVYLYNWSNGSLLKTWTQGTHYNGRAGAVQLSADGSRLMISTGNTSSAPSWGFYVFNTTTGGLIFSKLFNPNNSWSNGACLSYSGNKVSYTYFIDVAPYPNIDQYENVVVYDVNTGVKNLETSTYVVYPNTEEPWPGLGWYMPAIFDINDENILIGGKSQKRLYKLSDGSLVRSFTIGTGSGSGAGQAVMIQNWSLDNTRIVMGSYGSQTTKNIIVFDLYGSILGTFSPTTTTGITSVATNYDGSILAVAANVSGVTGQSCVYIY